MSLDSWIMTIATVATPFLVAVGWWMVRVDRRMSTILSLSKKVRKVEEMQEKHTDKLETHSVEIAKLKTHFDCG